MLLLQRADYVGHGYHKQMELSRPQWHRVYGVQNWKIEPLIYPQSEKL